MCGLFSMKATITSIIMDLVLFCFLGGDNAEIYRNRKSFFSINVQCLTDAHLKILDVVARWPGSVHDATIFANSAIRARFEAGHFPGSVIIGKYRVIIDMIMRF